MSISTGGVRGLQIPGISQKKNPYDLSMQIGRKKVVLLPGSDSVSFCCVHIRFETPNPKIPGADFWKYSTQEFWFYEKSSIYSSKTPEFTFWEQIGVWKGTETSNQRKISTG